MNFKKESNKTRYCVQYDDHPKMVSSALCSLVEHQSLVDIAIRCGNSTVHAHKCILAANSGYFREQLEKNPAVEQIVINGLDFAVVKSLVEFMYCGETNISEENFKFMIAASKSFQIRGIQALSADSHYQTDDSVQIPPPLFLTKKPKYSSTYFPMNNISLNPPASTEKISITSDPNFHRKLKRKYMKTEAEKACAKEAAASRLALEALQKELATTNQVSSFVIEDSCSETTVENFIPHSEEPFIDNLNHLQAVPLEVVNYADLNPTVLNLTSQILNVTKPVMANSVLQYDSVNSPRLQEAITDKLRQIFGGDVPANVEIMFKTNDGNFMSVTDEVLQNITKDSLQYQVIDEHGRAGEVQQLTINSKVAGEFPQDIEVEDPIAKYVNPIENISETEPTIVQPNIKEIKIDDISSDQSILEAIIQNEKQENELKFVTDTDLNTIQSMEDMDKKETPPTNNLGDRNFCDQFLNSSVELMSDTKEIYTSDIECIDNVVAESFLTTIPMGNEQNVGEADGLLLQKIKISDENIDLTGYSPSDRNQAKTPDPIDLDEDTKMDEIDADKFEIRNRKMFARKKNK